MTELASPVVGWLGMLLLLMPAATLLSKAAFVALRRWRPDALRNGGGLCYALLVAPVLSPLVWFGSAAVHHAEPGMATGACLRANLAEICLEPIAFLAVVLVAVAVGALRLAPRILPAFARAPEIDDDELSDRLAGLGLPAAIFRRIAVVEDEAIRTVGLWRPVIELGRQSAQDLDDEALAAAVRHEAAHVQAYDPLRYVVAMICSALNPLGQLLEPELIRWRAAREQACDREAVHHGASPLALAAAIVINARSSAVTPAPAALSGVAAQVQGRVALLLGYVESPPPCSCSRAGRHLALVAAAMLLVAPHAADAWPLLDLHAGLETGRLELPSP